MEIVYRTKEEVYRDGGREILRTVFSFPDLSEISVLCRMETFYGEILTRSQRFAEEALLPARKEELRALSEYDKKFSVKRRVFGVGIVLSESEEGVLAVLSVFFRERGRLFFQHKEEQLWAKRGEMYEMIPQKSRQTCSDTKRGKE